MSSTWLCEKGKNSFLDFSINFKFCNSIFYYFFGINWQTMFCLEAIKIVSFQKYYVNGWDTNKQGNGTVKTKMGELNSSFSTKFSLIKKHFNISLSHEYLITHMHFTSTVIIWSWPPYYTSHPNNWHTNRLCWSGFKQ